MRNAFLKILDSQGNRIPRASLSTSPFEGATTGRRLQTWGLSTSGPNTSLYQSLGSLRSRSRELIRNNPLVDGGVDSCSANIIGSGISPRWQLEDTDLKMRIQELWNDWTDQADFTGTCDFYGLQTLGTRALIDAGEFLVRLVPISSFSPLPVPFQIQLIETDHLDESYNAVTPNGNEIRMGIEVDSWGRRVAYWIYSEHPGESFLHSRFNQRVRIPASEMVHVFKPLRIGQMRGRPWLSSIILKIRELDQYEDAELVRKKTAAMFGGFVREINPEFDPGSYFGKTVSGTDESGASRDFVALEPGTFPILPPNTDVVFSNPQDVGTTYEVWIKQQLREIAHGMGITYEQLTGDLTQVNYSSIRAGLLEFRRRCEQIQHQVLIFQFCRPVAEYWLKTAVLSGAIDIPDFFKSPTKYFRIQWRPDGWPWVDPLKDQMAEQMAVRNGFKSRSRVVAERGEDVETVDYEIAEDNKRADDLGLVFDSDPRKTEKSGAMQSAEETTTAESMKE